MIEPSPILVAEHQLTVFEVDLQQPTMMVLVAAATQIQQVLAGGRPTPRIRLDMVQVKPDAIRAARDPATPIVAAQ